MPAHTTTAYFILSPELILDKEYARCLFSTRAKSIAVIEKLTRLKGPPGRTPRSLMPLVAGNGAVLVGVRGNQAGVDRDAFTANQAFAQAPLYHRLEQVSHNGAMNSG
jgi:hypothetical protein